VDLTTDVFKQNFSDKSVAYPVAQPYPHLVIDNFFPEEHFNQLVDAFHGPESSCWDGDRYDYKYQTKLACNRVHLLPPVLRETLYLLNAAPFLQLLEEVTGEKGLVGDPYYVGGGIHQIQRGGKLAIHADFTQPPHLKLYRRLNLLVYLNRDWQPEYGGQFELWDKDLTACRKKVEPIGNRCVVFTTTSNSYHGHPHPLECPEGKTRKSLAVYYYLLEPPAGHSGVLTRWSKRAEGEQMSLWRQSRLLTARFFWWVSYKFAGLAGRVDV